MHRRSAYSVGYIDVKTTGSGTQVQLPRLREDMKEQEERNNQSS